jgi:hypothetical protein
MNTRSGLLLLALLWLVPAAALAQDADSRRAVDGALKWLAAHQVTEGPEAGSWDTPRAEYRPATAGLAGLAFLANGSTPAEGPYAANVRLALRYVMGKMAPDGYLGQGDPSGMYIHAICLLFGLSALGMTGDAALEAQLADWCKRALTVTLDAREVRRSGKERGGWRYTPYTNESDLSVTSWQLLALHAARQCGFEVRADAIVDSLRYVQSAYQALDDGSGGYLYRPGFSTAPEPAVTGTALFIRSLLDRPDEERTAAALRFLDRLPPAWGGDQYQHYFFFASFYLTQGMFQIGGEPWEKYRQAMRLILVTHQSGDGSWPFPPDNAPQSRLAGPAYPTAMAVLILSLDQQYLPAYQRQKRLF